jgi:hypothetical protein
MEYDRGLTETGLHRSISTISSQNSERAEMRVVFTLPKHDLIVAIDVDVAATAQPITATVNILFIHCENAWPW